MFFQPPVSASTVAPMHDEMELYSDYHKDAFGCRPRKPQPTNPIERAVEYALMAAWSAEEARIMNLRTEVAKFDFSRSMEYLMRREGMSEKEAMRTIFLRHDDLFDQSQDFGSICYELHLPYTYETVLREAWEKAE